jgi:hypothetical membrane protein
MGGQATQSMLAIQPARAGHATWLDDRRVPGFLLFVLAAQFMTVIMLAASIAPRYDYAGGAISDLGVIDETAMLFNVSLIAVGVLNVVGGYLFYRGHRRRWVLATFALAGLGAIGAGLVPLDMSGFHGLFALLAFVFFNLEAIAAATIMRGPMRIVSFMAGAIGLVFVAVMVVGDAGNPAIFGPIGHGGAERMIAYPAMLWLLGFGGYLMETAGRSDPPRRR